MQTILVWAVRGAIIAFGVVALGGILRWIRLAFREDRDPWAVRVGLGMLVLTGVYVAGHARLLAEREELEQGRERYARFGDPRRTEQRRGEVRGWILDCTGKDPNALAGYVARRGTPARTYPLGDATVNLVGAASEREERDYVMDRLYTELLRRPRNFLEAGHLHAVGTDLRTTLCARPTSEAHRLLTASGKPGAVIAQDVQTGAVVAYAATGGPEDAPYGIQRYAPPGSVFKLALVALWYERGLSETQPISCPSRIYVGNRAISNAKGRSYGVVRGPTGMLIPSCNTAAIQMARQMRQQLGEEAFVEAYRRYGFLPYERGTTRPRRDERPFWSTSSEEWAERMSPPPARVQLGEKTGAFDWALLAIGQGPVDVTPIHMSRFLQAIGNGGVMLPPTLEWKLARDPERGERVMPEAVAEKLQRDLRVIVDRGTARRAAPIIEPTGWDLGGKTGTAQVYKQPDDGWFSGLLFDPQGKPRYALTVYLQGGGPGGEAPTLVAAELGRVLTQLRDMDDEGPARGPVRRRLARGE